MHFYRRTNTNRDSTMINIRIIVNITVFADMNLSYWNGQVIATNLSIHIQVRYINDIINGTRVTTNHRAHLNWV